MLAARRGGIRRVLLPARNSGDLEDLPPEVAQGLRFTFVETIEDVIFTLFPTLSGEGDDPSPDRPAASAAAPGDEAGGGVRPRFHPGHTGPEPMGAASTSSVDLGRIANTKGKLKEGRQVWEGEDVAGSLLESFL